jgi:hypothetical protein
MTTCQGDQRALQDSALHGCRNDSSAFQSLPENIVTVHGWPAQGILWL